MIRGQYFLLIIIILTVIVLIFAQKTIHQNVYDVEINGKPAPYSLKSIRIEDEEIYIASSYLEEHGDLKAKVNKDEIVMFRDNLSVKFSMGEEKSDAFEKSGKYFIPLKYLIEGLGGKYIWDKENKILIINFY